MTTSDSWADQDREADQRISAEKADEYVVRFTRAECELVLSFVTQVSHEFLRALKHSGDQRFLAEVRVTLSLAESAKEKLAGAL